MFKRIKKFFNPKISPYSYYVHPECKALRSKPFKFEEFNSWDRAVFMLNSMRGLTLFFPQLGYISAYKFETPPLDSIESPAQLQKREEYAKLLDFITEDECYHAVTLIRSILEVTYKMTPEEALDLCKRATMHNELLAIESIVEKLVFVDQQNDLMQNLSK